MCKTKVKAEKKMAPKTAMRNDGGTNGVESLGIYAETAEVASPGTTGTDGGRRLVSVKAKLCFWGQKSSGSPVPTTKTIMSGREAQ